MTDPLFRLLPQRGVLDQHLVLFAQDFNMKTNGFPKTFDAEVSISQQRVQVAMKISQSLLFERRTSAVAGELFESLGGGQTRAPGILNHPQVVDHSTCSFSES